ncbi:MAG TPA: diadenylate cyclase CdaA [Pyrinomonadaceae bacterium]|nr:diadenylate cyclase CdaA [Pyrinomonadaceae bacterium]
MFQTFSESLSRIVTLRSFIDFVVVFLLVYVLLRLVRGTRAAPMAAGMVGFGLLYWLAINQELATLEFVLRGALLYIGVAIIVLFQSEIRQALIFFGNRIQSPIRRRQQGQLGETIYDEIILAAASLASTKTGALIVVERGVGLRNYIDAGVQLDARLGYDLIVTVFNPNTPLHDGAVIIQNERIASAACFLPLTQNPRLTKDLGTRHRAAIGITEDTDAIVVVVSEETGIISFVEGGAIRRNLDTTQLRRMLLAAMEIQVVERKRERTKTLKESETEITLG